MAVGCDWVLVVVVVGSLSFKWLVARLSKSGSYVGSWEVGGIVNHRICKVEFNQPSCWLYSVLNFLVF